MKQKIQNWFASFREVSEGKEEFLTPENTIASFQLFFRALPVGTLSLRDGIWSFAYSDAFKSQTQFQPLPDFPNLNRIYESSGLYPFFLIRIPGSGQFKVKGIEIEKNEVELLKRFGRTSIANPFVLRPD